MNDKGFNGESFCIDNANSSTIPWLRKAEFLPNIVLTTMIRELFQDLIGCLDPLLVLFHLIMLLQEYAGVPVSF